MDGAIRAHSDPSGAEPGGHGYLAFLILFGVLLFFAVTVTIVITTLNADGGASRAEAARAGELSRKLPVYWTVRTGDTYARIAEKTGLSVSDLETFNPRVDPTTIRPGQRLKLRAKVPAPQAKPKGPKYATIRAGDSFGSVAAKTGKSIARLQQLNPKLKPSALQPGDRLRLR